jgi:hypothetical protein
VESLSTKKVILFCFSLDSLSVQVEAGLLLHEGVPASIQANTLTTRGDSLKTK